MEKSLALAFEDQYVRNFLNYLELKGIKNVDNLYQKFNKTEIYQLLKNEKYDFEKTFENFNERYTNIKTFSYKDLMEKNVVGILSTDFQNHTILFVDVNLIFTHKIKSNAIYQILINSLYEIKGKTVKIILNLSDTNFQILHEKPSEIIKNLEKLINESPFYVQKIFLLRPHHSFYQYVIPFLKTLLKSSPLLFKKLLILEDFSITHPEPPEPFLKTSDISTLQIFLKKEQIPQKFGGTLKTFKKCNLELSSAYAASQISTASSASNGMSLNLNKSEKLKNIQENKKTIKEIEKGLPILDKEIEKSRNMIKKLEYQIELLHNFDYKSLNLDFDKKKIVNSEVLSPFKEYENIINEKKKNMKKTLDMKEILS